MVKKIDRKIVAYKVKPGMSRKMRRRPRMTWCTCMKPCCARNG